MKMKMICLGIMEYRNKGSKSFFQNSIIPSFHISRFYMHLIAVLVLSFATVQTSLSQPAVIDEVAAVVGNHIVKKSDVEKQYLQYISQGNTETGGLRCAIIENLLLQKLLVQQASID